MSMNAPQQQNLRSAFKEGLSKLIEIDTRTQVILKFDFRHSNSYRPSSSKTKQQITYEYGYLFSHKIEKNIVKAKSTSSILSFNNMERVCLIH